MNQRQPLLSYLAPALFGAGLGVVGYLWLSGSAVRLQSGSLAEGLISIGLLCGFVGAYLALWQLLWIGRIGWIEPAYGHDRLSRLHHTNGLVLICLILLHPVLLTLGFARLSGRGLIAQDIVFLTQYDDVIWAAVAYVMMVSIVFISINLIRKRLNYEWWWLVHFTLYGAILLAFLHQVGIGPDLQNTFGQQFWWGLYAFVFANALWYRFTRPTVELWRHGYKVARVVAETGDVNSVYITGRGLEGVPARAGQFVIVRFLARGYWTQQHPFSLSEAPNGREFRLSIKGVGDFTRTIGQLPVGTPVLLDGPHGRFGPERVLAEKKVLLIAGGIGITPLRSLFEEFARAGRTVDLVYSARSAADLALKRELDGLVTPVARVHYVTEDTMGRLSPELIAKLVPDVAERGVYLCGPPPMMKVVVGDADGFGGEARRYFV